MNHRPLDLEQLPTGNNPLMFDNSFIMSDNLDSDVPLSMFDPEISKAVQLGIPFKVRFTMTLICFGGTMRIKLNMQEYIICKGQLLTVMEGAIGECEAISADGRFLIAAFSSHFPVMVDTRLSSAVREHLMDSPLVRLLPEDQADILQLYRMMRRKTNDASFPYKREVAVATLSIIYAYACRYWLAAGVEPPKKLTRKQQIFGDFMKLVEQYSSSHRELTFYAGKLCITPKYLSQVVQEASGQPARKWITDRVVLEAKVMLKGERMSIQQISEALGFPSQSFFGTYFRKATGLSPKAYREHH